MGGMRTERGRFEWRKGLGVVRRVLVMSAAATAGGMGWFAFAAAAGEIPGENAAGRPGQGAVGGHLQCSEAPIQMRAEVRVCYRRVQVVDTEHGRVKRSCTGWYAMPRKVYKGEVQLGDYLYFEQEAEEPTNEEPYLVTSFTPEPFSVLMLQAERVEFFSAGCARLHGAVMTKEWSGGAKGKGN